MRVAHLGFENYFQWNPVYYNSVSYNRAAKRMPAIFISHSSADNEQAKSLSKALGEQGFESLFLDIDPEAGLQAGSRWEAVLYSNLIRSHAVIAIHSEHWKKSRWCFAEITHAKLLGRTIIPVCIDESALDSSLREFQAIILYSDTQAIYRVVASLRTAGIDPRKTSPWDRSRVPFPGLEPFRSGEAPAFFGREEEVHSIVDRLALLRRLGDRQLVLLTGASGCGKSSLMLAGVVPTLTANRVNWCVSTPFRPGRDPRSGLRYSLGSLDIGNPPKQNGAHGTVEQTLILVIDQLEELFTQSSPAEAVGFLRDLQSIFRTADSSILALGTIRTDSLLTFEKAAPAVALRYETLPVRPMDKHGLASAILGPCELDGIALEPGLQERMVEECGDGRALALLA
jgi:TIR domain